MAVVVIGLAKVQKKLETLEPKLQKKLSRGAMRKGMKVVQQAAQQEAPEESDLLKKSIKVRAGKRSRRGMSINVQTKDGDYKGETFYGAFVNFGHKTGKRGSKDRKQVEGSHFMEKAYEKAHDRAVQITREEILKGIDQIVKGG